jgi:hypothetical protein
MLLLKGSDGDSKDATQMADGQTGVFINIGSSPKIVGKYSVFF